MERSPKTATKTEKNKKKLLMFAPIGLLVLSQLACSVTGEGGGQSYGGEAIRGRCMQTVTMLDSGWANNKKDQVAFTAKCGTAGGWITSGSGNSMCCQ